MDVCIRTRLTTGFAAVGVGALVMAPVVTGQPAQPSSPTAQPAVTLSAATQPLQVRHLLAQPTALAPVQQVAPLQSQNPLAEQVGFHVAFVGDFLSTGAVLFAREFAIPGALLQDIRNGTPAPVAVSRALQSFAQIELEAGRELVGFAAEYVSFQLNFFANLATMPVAVLSAFATSAPHVQTAVVSADDFTTLKTGVEDTSASSKKTDVVTAHPKKFRSTIAESEPTTSTAAKTRDEDTDSVASGPADSGAAAPTTHGKHEVTHKRSAAGSTASSTTGGSRQADAGQHEPRHEHGGNAKGDGDKGD